MKKFKNRILPLLFFIILAELSPYLFSKILLNQPFSRGAIRLELEQQLSNNGDTTANEGDGGEEYLSDHILHPYLGFVSAPNAAYNKFCFPGPDPILKRSPDTINLCLMGGSVCMNLYKNSISRLCDKLKESKKFRDKNIQVALLALGGFKQPQQLLALNYFLALGARYDLVINLDGFNEIVLPYSDNLPFGVFPSYPRHWNIYSRKHINTAANLILAERIRLGSERADIKNFFSGTPLRFSNFGLLTWKILDNKKSNQLYEAENRLRDAVKNMETDYQSTGPQFTVDDTLQFFKEQAEFWKQSSVQIGKLGKAMDFDYFHFLQPNQYLDGTKSLTEEELSNAYESGDFAYKAAVQKGYPLLIEKGKEMKAEDIDFIDLTEIFKNEKKTIYNDKCCHFNQYGYDLIADAISGYIINYYNKKDNQDERE